jgi:hypothetical protein
MFEKRNPAPLVGSGSRAGIDAAERYADTLSHLAPQQPSDPLAPSIAEFRRLIKGALRGFAVVELSSGLILREVAIFSKNGRAWAGMPSKPRLGRNGVPVKNHAGFPQYDQLVAWATRDQADRFSQAVVALIEREFGPLDGGDDR